MDVSLKAYHGQFYLMAAAKGEAKQAVTFSFACGSPLTAEVLDENRSINISANSFTDTFADSNTVHIYKLNGGNTCGLGVG